MQINLADKLKSLRKEKNISQEKLAQYPPYGVFIATNDVKWNSMPTFYYHNDIRLPVLEYMQEIYPDPWETE